MSGSPSLCLWSLLQPRCVVACQKCQQSQGWDMSGSPSSCLWSLLQPRRIAACQMCQQSEGWDVSGSPSSYRWSLLESLVVHYVVVPVVLVSCSCSRVVCHVLFVCALCRVFLLVSKRRVVWCVMSFLVRALCRVFILVSCPRVRASCPSVRQVRGASWCAPVEVCECVWIWVCGS